VTIGNFPVISQLGFLLGIFSGGGNSFVDILVYDSPTRTYPGMLIYKFSRVDLSTFTSGQIGCVPFNDSQVFAPGQTLWIGFWTYQSNARYVVSRQSRLSGPPYYFNVGNPSPSIATNFPSGAFNTENYQLVMGLSTGSPPQQCTNINSCSACTGNSNCVWCLNTQSCISSQNIPTCPSWTRNPSLCNSCSQYTSCVTCASVQNQCSWWETNGKPSICINTPLDANCTSAITNPIFC